MLARYAVTNFYVLLKHVGGCKDWIGAMFCIARSQTRNYCPRHRHTIRFWTPLFEFEWSSFKMLTKLGKSLNSLLYGDVWGGITGHIKINYSPVKTFSNGNWRWFGIKSIMTFVFSRVNQFSIFLFESHFAHQP